MREDFRIIIKQVNGEFVLKEVARVSHQKGVQKLIISFLSIRVEYVLSVHNMHADSLAI